MCKPLAVERTALLENTLHILCLPHAGATPFLNGQLYTTLCAACQERNADSSDETRFPWNGGSEKDCEPPCSQPQENESRLRDRSVVPAFRGTGDLRRLGTLVGRRPATAPGEVHSTKMGDKGVAKRLLSITLCLPTAQCLDFSPLKTDHI